MTDLGPGTLTTQEVLLEFHGTQEDGTRITVRVVLETEMAHP